MSASGITRRELVRRGGLLALPVLLRGRVAAAEPFGATAAPVPRPRCPGLRVGPEIYQSIGVRPFVNARGTYTILTGSTMLPEPRAAMDAASRHYVHLDELAGGDRQAPRRADEGRVGHGDHRLLGGPHPRDRGLRHRRQPRPPRARPRPARLPEGRVHHPEALAQRLRRGGPRGGREGRRGRRRPRSWRRPSGPRTALIYILAGPNADEGPLSTKAICEAAKKRGVPVVVDCAAEILTVPNVHLQLGADLVTYSGGKCLRGPQAAGLLLGRKDLVKAAWVGSAPHHGFARGFKVGKEEAMAMLAAVEAWTKRDYEAEIRSAGPRGSTRSRKRIAPIAGVTTSVTPAEGLSNRMPVLQIRWDKTKLGHDRRGRGEAALRERAAHLALPRARARARANETGLTIGPYMMAPGDEKVVAERLFAVLSKPPQRRGEAAGPARGGPHRHVGRPDRVRGQRLDPSPRTCGSAATTSTAPTRATSCPATCGARSTATPSGSAAPGSTATRSTTRSPGKVAGDEMTGDVSLGEYLDARFSAKRHASGRA